MKAIVLNRETESKIELADLPVPQLGTDQVRVQIKAAALNHRDEWCRQGLYPNLKDGVILGSDGAGIVSEVAHQGLNEWLGREVIINPALNWGESEKVQSKDFQILGMPGHGTLTEFVNVDFSRIFPKPSFMSWEEAAALPLGGLTAFRALMVQGGLQKGEKVLVTGFGGGVAQFAVQYALAKGGEVFVSSSSDDKIASALQLGVKKGFNYKNEDWAEAALQKTGGFDLIIDSAMGDTINNLIHVVKPGGRIVFYGATKGNPDGFNARKVFWNQIKLIGSTMGSDKDFAEMLSFVNQNKIRPLVDRVFSLEEAEKAFDRMKAGQQLGKIVIKI
ncbi:quinone oxidoreductase family protein [Cecembia rubra]|uniref:NADPH:quinone reductase-like Zn-dependent oxidoreductase n=1 Tax=Cecembia rubra TaxID=1485585 RepID=A0A2P8EDR7_9BACT|nr:zinc-binding dehydrogenase [Cecembia rubra]PSL07622.1 NADPH:quinone reductase-like Zn-dependent oxidoreductase [Cecembia rubra]